VPVQVEIESMNEIKLKVCGMKEDQNIREVGLLAPDFMGFIFYEKSPRFVGHDFKIPDQPRSVKRVGVFVNASTEVILEKAHDHQLEFIQLHGQEPVEQCQELTRNKLKILKAFAVDDEMDFSLTKPYRDCCDFFLFDTKGKYFGGNAQAFNWNVLKRYDQQTPFFLSGGIGPENVVHVKELKDMNLHAIDINSGVEVRPGLKDVTQISRVKNLLKR
jgi:phosphoribosylanthranilate isomerase